MTILAVCEVSEVLVTHMRTHMHTHAHTYMYTCTYVRTHAHIDEMDFFCLLSILDKEVPYDVSCETNTEEEIDGVHIFLLWFLLCSYCSECIA